MTLQDLADKLHTTRTTVSRALSDHYSISKEMKSQVLSLAKEMGYLNNRIASSLRNGKSYLVGVLIPSAEISFFGSIVHGIEQVARKNGYNIVLVQTEESLEKETKGIDTLMELKVDGILASLSKQTKDISHFMNVLDLGTPVVLFDRTNKNIPSVVNNDFDAAFEVTNYLINKGCRKIFHIGGPQYLSVFEQRYLGYQKALQAAGITFEKKWYKKGNVSIAAGENAVKDWLRIGEIPDAIFAVEDYTALGALNALKDANVKIPDQVSVIGFANELFGKHITPSLTTMDQQTGLIGKGAMNLLLSIIKKEIEKNIHLPKEVPAKLVLRASTKN